MEQIKKLALFVLVTFVVVQTMHAQTNNIVRRGLIRAQLTLTPSYMFAPREPYFYLHGNLEGYLENRVSVSGEGYFSMGSITDGTPMLKYNHNLFFGMSKHFANRGNDLYVGLQPGCSFTKLNNDSASMGVNPVFSAVVGYNLYVYSFFHFFVQSRFIVGHHYFDAYQNITEVRFSAGLGLNLNTMK